MLMIDPKYEGLYGGVERVGKSSVQTLFYHLFGFPIFPQGSYWVTGSALTGWSKLSVMEIKRSWPSILAGYLRGWAASSAFWVSCVGIFCIVIVKEPAFDGDPMPFGRTVVGPIALAAGIMAAIGYVVLWLATRRAPSAVELARRAIFQRFVGSACDPALFDDPWSRRDDLKREMSRLAGGLGLDAGFDAWDALVRRPDVMLPPPYLQRALTVARLERSAPAKTTNVADLPALEELIWARIVALDPSALAARPS